MKLKIKATVKRLYRKLFPEKPYQLQNAHNAIKDQRAWMKFYRMWMRKTHGAKGTIPRYSTYSGISFHVISEENLSAMRTLLRTILGHWTDEVHTIWAQSSTTAMIIYHGDKYRGIRLSIDFTCNIVDFPESLKKGGCDFQEVARTETAYVCDTK